MSVVEHIIVSTNIVDMYDFDGTPVLYATNDSQLSIGRALLGFSELFEIVPDDTRLLQCYIDNDDIPRTHNPYGNKLRYTYDIKKVYDYLLRNLEAKKNVTVYRVALGALQELCKLQEEKEEEYKIALIYYAD